MKKYDTKKMWYALVAAVVCFGISFAVSYWIGFKSAEKETAQETVKKKSVPEIVDQLKQTLPMDLGTGIIWTDMTCENDVVIYDYAYSELHASDIDQEMKEWVVANDKPEIIRSLVSEYGTNKDVSEWIDCIIENRYKVKYRYSDCECEYIYSFTILPSEWEEALKLR